MRAHAGLVGLSFLSVVAFVCAPAPAQETAAQGSLDARVEYVEYLRSRSGFETTIEDDQTSGIAVTCRTGD